MSRRIWLGISVLVCVAIYFGSALAQITGPITGQWTLSGPVFDDRVQFSLSRLSRRSSMSSSSSLPISQINGLARAQLASPVPVVARFDIVRDAGTLRLEGFLQNGSGGGNFTFVPNTTYASEMRALGYSDLSDEKIFQLGTHDVSIAYIRSMIAAGIRPESANKLISMRIHNVTVQFVNEMSALGFTDLKPDKLVTLRIHGVSADFARSLKDLGFNAVTPDQMVTMRIHRITPDYIRMVRARGFNNVTIDQLIRLKIHGILN